MPREDLIGLLRLARYLFGDRAKHVSHDADGWPTSQKHRARESLTIKCVVACLGGDGPTLVPVTVECTQYQYDSGDHYGEAKDPVGDQRYDGPMVAFDENEGPDRLFARCSSSQEETQS